MLAKQTIIDRIEILQDQTVAVRYLITITEDGLLLTDQVKGNYFKPGDDYSAENDKVRSVCALIHTPEVIAAYQAQAAKLPAQG